MSSIFPFIYNIYYISLLFVGIIQDLSTYAFNQSTRDALMEILNKFGSKTLDLPSGVDGSEANSEDIKHDESLKVEEAWHMLYNDCLYGLETCVEGDLKHYHKARYALAQGLYRRGERGDLGRAKDELSFCFKSSRSSFTINMWEIDSTIKKGRYGFNACPKSLCYR